MPRCPRWSWRYCAWSDPVSDDISTMSAFRGAVACSLDSACRCGEGRRRYWAETFPPSSAAEGWRLLLVREEPASALAAEFTGFDLAQQQRRRCVQLLLGLLVHRLGHRHGGVESDQVGERQRAHRVRTAG